MKILLSYSMDHFDPSKKPGEHKFWGSSTSILAKALYETLSNLGDVTYIDARNYPDLSGQKFDLFVGMYINFNQIRESCTIKKSVFFAMNMHFAERRHILLQFLRRHRLPIKSLAGWDILDVADFETALTSADAIVCVGNVATYNSYIKHGVAKDKIKVFNYGMQEKEAVQLPFKAQSGPRRYVYAATEIGLRKGFDIVSKLIQDRSFSDKNWHLDILGLPNNPHYEKKLQQLVDLYPKKVTYHGWVDVQDKKYGQILERTDYLLFPSLEEGQAGTALDAIRHGAVPILSEHTGIDWSPLGWLELTLSSRKNRDLMLRSLDLSRSELLKLKQQTLEYYAEYHGNFYPALSEIITHAVSKQLYPTVSLVLPIYNKQRTILGLLKCLDRACRSYKNVELHIIFDGCRDQTEVKVRRFYRNNTAYPVIFTVTPNIFEVKSNNIGLKKSKGKYAVIVQDDNFIYDPDFIYETVLFMDRNEHAAVLGGLGGVNYYPRGTKKITGPGQIALNENEAYHRQNGDTNPEFQHRIYETDACMRGPLIFRKSFLEKHGYLDEAYAPLYQDDMDICFRAYDKGYKVYAALMNVKNETLSMRGVDAKKAEFFSKVIKKNTDIFYKRWQSKIRLDKSHYSWVNRTLIIAHQASAMVRWIDAGHFFYIRLIRFLLSRKQAKIAPGN